MWVYSPEANLIENDTSHLYAFLRMWQHCGVASTGRRRGDLYHFQLSLSLVDKLTRSAINFSMVEPLMEKLIADLTPSCANAGHDWVNCSSWVFVLIRQVECFIREIRDSSTVTRERVMDSSGRPELIKIKIKIKDLCLPRGERV